MAMASPPSCPAPVQGCVRASGSEVMLLQQAACSRKEGGRRLSPPGSPQRRAPTLSPLS